MNDILEQAKEAVETMRRIRALTAGLKYVQPKDLQEFNLALATIEWCLSSVRAEAQREAFEAGYMEGFGTNNAETLDAKRDAAFAAYLTRQAGLQVDLKRE